MRISGSADPPGCHLGPSRLGSQGPLERLGLELDPLGFKGMTGLGRKLKDRKSIAEALGISEITLDDIISGWKSRRDPQRRCQRPILRTDVLDTEGLKPGMVLEDGQEHRFGALCGYRRPIRTALYIYLKMSKN